MEYYPHGAFGFHFSLNPNYLLVTMTGTWNRQCVDIYSAYLKRRVFHRPDERRCVVFDCRNWGFQTPDCMAGIHDLNEYIATHYRELQVAYLLSRRNRIMARRIIETQYDRFRSRMKLRFFAAPAEAVAWLREEGFNLPDLEDSDFPEALSAEEYMNDPGPDPVAAHSRT